MSKRNRERRVAKAFAKGKRNAQAECPYARVIYAKAWFRGAGFKWIGTIRKAVP